MDDAPAPGPTEHQILSALDLSTMNDFGLDRFLPSREDGQQPDDPRSEGMERTTSIGGETDPSLVQPSVGNVRKRMDEIDGQPGSSGLAKRARIAQGQSEGDLAVEERIQSGQLDDGGLEGSSRDMHADGDAPYRDQTSQGPQSPHQPSPEDEIPASVIASHAHLTPAEMLEVPINELTREQRRERQKEGNRLAALRSRGKKRGEL
jgi:hypothetical protein